MSTVSLNNMPKKNARPVKSGRIKCKRNKTKYCKTMGCSYFTKKTHCSACELGMPEKMTQFKKKLGCVVNIMTKHSQGIVGDTILDTLRNIHRSDKQVLFKAKDVLHLFKGDYQRSTSAYNPILMSPADKILIRVVDYWNLHSDLGFNSTIQCYWCDSWFDMRDGLDSILYARRFKLFAKESLLSVIETDYAKFFTIWYQLLHCDGPVPNPKDAVRLTETHITYV